MDTGESEEQEGRVGDLKGTHKSAGEGRVASEEWGLLGASLR